jgi:hypothetical protein
MPHIFQENGLVGCSSDIESKWGRLAEIAEKRPTAVAGVDFEP